MNEKLDVASIPPKSSAWTCLSCGRLNAPFRNACTSCSMPKGQKEKTA